MSRNHKNQLLVGSDNLDRMRSMKAESVDLIYLDPPFNTQKIFSSIESGRSKAAFADIWTLGDFSMAQHIMMRKKHPSLHAVIEGMHAVNGNSWLAYLSYMGVRLLEMHRILKPHGSIYYHCDPTMSHGIKLVMDAIFGSNQFQNEFIWYYSGGGASPRRWARKHDTILFYTKGDSGWVFNADEVRVPHKWDKGQLRADGSPRNPKGKIADDVFHHHSIMPWSQERTGYPTQKPLELLTRIIKASSNRGDIVLDPFCGCATAMEAAEKLGRRWIGIDISHEVVDIVKKRINSKNYEVESRRRWNNQRGYGASKKAIKEYCLVRQLSPHASNQCYCNGCGIMHSADTMETDHVHPKGKGGILHYDNAQLLCISCNRLKDNKDMAFLYAQLAKKVSTASRNRNVSRQRFLEIVNNDIVALILAIAERIRNKKQH